MLLLIINFNFNYEFNFIKKTNEKKRFELLTDPLTKVLKIRAT